MMPEAIDENLIDLQLQEDALNLAKRRAKWNANRSLLSSVVNALCKIGIEPSFGTNLDVSCTGDSKKLAAVVRIFRTAGFSSNAEKPKKGDTSWYAYFDSHESPIRIWFCFSSSVCRRIKVGTKMVETDIYETQCGESLGEEPKELECATVLISETESTPALMDPDIPF